MSEKMPAELVENLVDFCENRASVYALLSRCYEREITAEFAQEFTSAATLESENDALVQEFAALQADLNQCDEAKIEQLAVVFNRVFYGMGPRTAQKAFPYESVYTSQGGLLMQEAFAQVSHLYQAEHFAKNPSFTEPEDHIAVELQFMACLCERAVQALREGDEARAEAVLRRQQEFVQQHLLNWIEPFGRDMQRSAEEGFYVHLAAFMQAYVNADSEALAEVLD